MKTPGLYQVPELRYPFDCCHPCCCHCPCRRPPPSFPPHHRRHHREADDLDVRDVLAKTPGLYLVPELRYPCFQKTCNYLYAKFGCKGGKRVSVDQVTHGIKFLFKNIYVICGKTILKQIIGFPMELDHGPLCANLCLFFFF